MCLTANEASSRQAKSFSASEASPRVVWNPRVHYRVHKSPPLLPFLSQINPHHIRYILTLSASKHRYSKLSPFSDFPTKIPYTFLSLACHMPRPSYPPFSISPVIYGEQHKAWRSTLCILLQPPFIHPSLAQISSSGPPHYGALTTAATLRRLRC